MPENTFAAELWRNLEIEEARARRRSRVGCAVWILLALALVVRLLIGLVRTLT
jgi:hypothetical protein